MMGIYTKSTRVILTLLVVGNDKLCAARGIVVELLPPHATTVPSFFKATV